MRLSGRAPIDVIAAQAGVSRGVCADLIRCWEDAGLARITRSNKSVRRAELLGTREHPPAISRDCRGSLIYVGYSDENHYVSILKRGRGRRVSFRARNRFT